MLLVGVDTETTGLDPYKGHKIIEVSMVTARFDYVGDKVTAKVIDKYTQRIDPQRAMDPAAVAVHGITPEDLKGQPVFADVADAIATRLQRADCLIAHNADFDIAFVGCELLNAKRTIPAIEVFCTMENGKWASSTGKMPSLQELCFAVGVEYDTDKAHSAEYDVMVTLAALKRGMERGFFVLEGLTPQVSEKEEK